jgi:hypothetical protein
MTRKCAWNPFDLNCVDLCVGGSVLGFFFIVFTVIFKFLFQKVNSLSVIAGTLYVFCYVYFLVSF